MKSKLSMLLLLCVFLAPLTAAAQESAAAPAAVAASNIVPSQIKYSGVLKDSSGRTLTSLTGVTFLLYKDEQGGAPLWMETQNVQPDKAGRYSVQLGAASKDGIPTDLFMNGEARWLEVQAQGQQEQPRVMLSSVPYAMKAGDAQTVGGLPASAFVLAAPSSVVGRGATSSAGRVSTPNAPAPGSITGSGTAGFLPKFTGSATIGNSAVFQSGSSASAKIGIGTTAPQALFHVDQKVPSGGMDVAKITSGGSTDVASLLLKNTSPGGLRLRVGVGTGTGYLASSGALAFVTADTGSPSFPSGPRMTIDTSGNLSVAGTINGGRGILITQLLGNFGGAGPTSSGYFNMISNYVPPVNATAFTFNRCSLSTTGAGQQLVFRSAILTGGTPQIGNAFYLFPSSANTETIFGENNDFFTLTAGQSYDFGINFFTATAGGALTCSTVVQIFSR